MLLDRGRAIGAESGFTLVEILVVMLILGVLAAIAVPSFFNHRDKARDADAKSLVRTAQTAIETYGSANKGSYAGATVDKLQAIETTLEKVPDAAFTVHPMGGSGLYRVGVASATGNVFYIERVLHGAASYTCTNENVAGCPSGGNWGG